jgi:cell division protein FtsI (penicillin-binding protein 3)
MVRPQNPSRSAVRSRLRTPSRPSNRLVPPEAIPTPQRLRLVWIILLSGCVLLGINLIWLQVFRSTELLTRAKQQQTTYLRPFTPRRPVVDRLGNAVAIDEQVYTIFAHPKYFDKKTTREVAKALAPILNQSEGELQKKLESAKTGIRLVDHIKEDSANRIKELYIDGLDFIPQEQRVYPQQDLLGSIIGYVDNAQVSQGGVESSYKHLLERSEKAVRLNKTGQGNILPDDVPNGFIHQDDLRLQLTIDNRLQREIQKIVTRQVKTFGAKRGLVIVMDAQDGSILSMVSNPSFDPNEYWGVKDISVFKNWGLTDLYEPGSTFKPINVAIALEAGTVKLEDHFYDSGTVFIEGWPINNSDNAARGSISLTDIIKYSSNVGMVRIAQTMKPSVYYSWLERIGLGQSTGIDLPSEAPGYLKERKTYMSSPIEVATTAFGQGFAMTPMQLIKLHAMLANGGKMVTPHVVKGLYDSQNRPHWQPQQAMPKQIFSPKNTKAILRMMEAVVDSGTGKAAQVKGYRVAGKTGTAQKATESGGYSESRFITSFVGIFPVDNPRYVVLSVLDEPQGLAYGGTTAAPIVREVIELVAGVEQVPPSKLDP